VPNASSFHLELSMDVEPKVDNRKHPRFETHLPIRFNLNPDYHFVPAMRKLGVGGTIRDISLLGVGIDSQMDLLDVFQVFPEEMEDESPFELELVLWDSRGTRLLIRGSVRWCQVSEPDNGMRHFEAGLYLKDDQSRTAARDILESITGVALA
jgi:hypothetical protein